MKFTVPVLLSVLIFASIPARASGDAFSQHPEWENILSGKSAQFSPAPNEADVSDEGDSFQLSDGLFSLETPMWYDRQNRSPVGWVGAEQIEIVFDLEKDQPIRGAALRVGAGQAGVAWPKSILFLVSEDGESYTPVTEITEVTPLPIPAPEAGYSNQWLMAEDVKTHGRYVKFLITPGEADGAKYFFVDEIEVYRGEDEWLKLPLEANRPPGNPHSPRPESKNIALGKSVELNTPSNDPSVADEKDSIQLTDGLLSTSTPIWSDKSCVGWTGPGLVEFTVDLGADEPIQGVALHLAAGQAGVEWPTNIEIYVGNDGSNFSPIGDMMEMLAESPPEEGYARFWLVADKMETHGRYVKFVITPKNLGNGAYVYMDELEIYRGNQELLNRPSIVMETPEKWSADLANLKWHENIDSVPISERPERRVLVDGNKEIGADDPLWQCTANAEGGVTFSLKGEASKPRAMNWSAKLTKPVSGKNCRYVALTFRTQGIRRTYDVRPLVTLQGIAAQGNSGEINLLESNMPPNDGLRHILIRELPEGFTLQQIHISLLTEDDSASLTLEGIEMLSEVPEVFNAEIEKAGKDSKDFLTVDLSKQANGDLSSWFERCLSKNHVAVDSARALPTGLISVSGAPFYISSSNASLVVMPESHPEDGQVEFLGHKVDKRYLDPVSRHDQLGVDVNAKAKEVLLLLALDSSPIQIRGGLTNTALRLDDIESLSVELTYDNGPSEIAFPYALAERSCYIPARGLAAYAVTADPARTLRKVTLHNHHYGPSFALTGLTLNLSAPPVAPALAELEKNPTPQKTRKNSEPSERPLQVEFQGDKLKISNKYYEYTFNLSDGFVIENIINRYNPDSSIQLGESAGLRIRVGEKIYTGRCFRAEAIRADKTSVELKLTSLLSELPLDLRVDISAGDSSELAFVTTVTNTGSTPIATELSLPELNGLIIDDIKSTRIFFPQYRNVDTCEPIALRAPYGPEFACQFFTVYNPISGTGLMVRSDNPEQRMMDFVLNKNENGVSCGIYFPEKYNEIAPGQSRSHPKISLFTHSGDWRDAAELYTKWVRSWYKPYRSQDKDFFLNAWDVACYRTSDRVSWNDSRVPPVITADRSRWVMDETLEFERQRLGHIPDLIHFYNWNYNDHKQHNEYGVHSTPSAYEQVGGLEFFREGIKDLQEKWNIPVSLYTVIDRFRISALPDQKLAQELIESSHYKQMDNNDISSKVRASDAVDGIIYLQPGHPKWTDFFVNDITKLQKDTGCKLIYIDVFPYFSHLEGYQRCSPREADLSMIKRIRESLPPDVAIWTEYPFTDVASQYADGCLQYYFIDVSQVFARRYNLPERVPDLIAEMPLNIQRFSTPTYRTFALPGYIEVGSRPSQVDAVFFNGEAFQEDTYRLHHSRIRERLNKAYALKKKYTDCFNSMNPQPHVDTMVRGVYANLFPGNSRNVWTLYNGRPKTYSGKVLEIPHREGARYYDAWNDVELKPIIENGIARIAQTIHPQGLGCIVQEWGDHAEKVAYQESAHD